MSQEQVGRMLGVSRAILYRWERDAVPVPSSRMATVRRFLLRVNHRRPKD
jgi:transcriptional regulator with XRE-family HTH domain